jgi:hypothetical protein
METIRNAYIDTSYSLGLYTPAKRGMAVAALVLAILYMTKMPADQFTKDGGMIGIPYTSGGASEPMAAAKHPLVVAAISGLIAYTML